MIIQRKLEKEVLGALEYHPAVVLLGPRQVGKTTLARVISKTTPSIYIDLESSEDIRKLDNPLDFFSYHTGKLIILDEVQRIPGLFNILRGVIDKRRVEGFRSKQFLLLGSASRDLLKQSSESLAGRVCYMELLGLNALEIDDFSNLRSLWLRGGFPESYLNLSDVQAMNWLSNMIHTYLERELPQLGVRVSSQQFLHLWTMMAHAQGENLNSLKLADNIGVSSKTINHYIDLLESLLLVRRLEPLFVNTKKRLVKSPRIYIRDTGILHCLLNVYNYDALLSHTIVGKSWEGFVIENIQSILPFGVHSYFYRTQRGAEIDLLIQFMDGETWAVEIKCSSSPQTARGFTQSCENLQVQQRYIVYRGDDEYPTRNNTVVISLRNFMKKLIEKNMRRN